MSKPDLPKSYMAPPAAGNPRKTEAWALTQAAIRLKAGQDSRDREAMLAAVRLNWRLWTIIQSELLDPMSTVPLEVRVNVLSLSRFVDARTVDFLAVPLAAKLDPLIVINRELARGLYTNPGATEPTGTEAGIVDHEEAGTEPDTVAPRAPAGSIRLSI